MRPQRYGFQHVTIGGHDPLFGGGLGFGVRGAVMIRVGKGFVAAFDIAVAVGNARRRGEHEPLNSQSKAGVDNMLRAIDIDRSVDLRVSPGTGLRGRMNNRLTACCGRLHIARLANIAASRLYPDFGKLAGLAALESHRLVALGQKLAADGLAEKTPATGDQDFHGCAFAVRSGLIATRGFMRAPALASAAACSPVPPPSVAALHGQSWRCGACLRENPGE